MNSFGLPPDIFSEILGVLKIYPEIESAKIFGSRAKGNYKRYSDVDIVLYANTSKNLAATVQGHLNDLYSIYAFDVLQYESITHAELKLHIDNVGIEIYTANNEYERK